MIGAGSASGRLITAERQGTLDTEDLKKSADPDSSVSGTEAPEPDAARRGFLKLSGKALYLAPTLTILGTVSHSALALSPPGPPGDESGADDSDAPAPTR